MLLEEGLGYSGCMFWVIVFHEPVVWKFFPDERKEDGLQNVEVEACFHDAIKNTNVCGTMSANPCPDVNL